MTEQGIVAVERRCEYPGMGEGSAEGLRNLFTMYIT